jgi:membrane fusion protein, copper/silver efflux system
MRKISLIIKENYKLLFGVLIIGMILGWLIFAPSREANPKENLAQSHEDHNHKAEEATTWTCSMHPQIKQAKPGKCPICAMDLIPLTSMQSSAIDFNPNEVVMSESAAQLANIETIIVAEGLPEKSLYLQGKVEADERNIAELTARFGGRIEKLFVNFTGQEITKGEKLASIYSPELMNAQRELLEALSFKDSRPSLYQAARGKLKLWDLSDAQIKNIEENKDPQVYFDVLSPASGTIDMRHVAIGDYVKEGTPLFKVIDLSKVWIMFDAYESDLPWIKLGEKVNYTVQTLSGKKFTGFISYIDPFINGSTRVAKVRIEVANTTRELKPQMFVNGIVQSSFNNQEKALLIPKSAVLWTGKRAIVYVKVPERENPSFLFREIVLGPDAGGFYIVADGLKAGEEIASNGVFKIDASAQLVGLPSMMNPKGTKAATEPEHMEMNASPGKEAVAHEMFKVYGNCEMCKERIEKAALSVPGISTANWDIESKMLHLNYLKEKVSIREAHKAIAKVGHDTELEKAADDVYENLPGCCLYDREENK